MSLRGGIIILDIFVLDISQKYRWFDLKRGVPKWKYDQYQYMKSQIYPTASAFGYFIVNMALIENSINGKITTEERGKPVFSDYTFHFNITHSENKVAVGLSNEPIGIDIEKISKDFIDISEWYLSKEEKDIRDQLKINLVNEYLCTIWTLKEAYGKLIGTGLDYQIKKVLFYKNSETWRCRQENKRIFKGQIVTSKVSENFILSVCAKSQTRANIKFISEDEVISRGKKVGLF